VVLFDTKINYIKDDKKMKKFIYEYFYDEKNPTIISDWRFWVEQYLDLSQSQNYRKKHDITLLAKDNIHDCPPKDLWSLYESIASEYHIYLLEEILIKDNNSNIKKISIEERKTLDIRFIKTINVIDMQMTIEVEEEVYLKNTRINQQKNILSKHKKRYCQFCGADISHRTLSHYLCYRCWTNKNDKFC
jgi:hypothetical protein